MTWADTTAVRQLETRRAALLAELIEAQAALAALAAATILVDAGGRVLVLNSPAANRQRVRCSALEARLRDVGTALRRLGAGGGK